jgi:hypothetical protein
MTRGTVGYLGSDPAKSQFRQIELVNRDIDHLNGIYATLGYAEPGLRDAFCAAS